MKAVFYHMEIKILTLADFGTSYNGKACCVALRGCFYLMLQQAFQTDSLWASSSNSFCPPRWYSRKSVFCLSRNSLRKSKRSVLLLSEAKIFRFCRTLLHMCFNCRADSRVYMHLPQFFTSGPKHWNTDAALVFSLLKG